ncbi:spore coat protein [Candidatus Poribacteria bacterium]|nr:spore coat protein [Candidatus Poribacteria bacterium]
MKGVILAGGNGKRLFPLTKTTPKCLLRINDKPMIYYPLISLSEAGIHDLLVVIDGQFLASFTDALNNPAWFERKKISFAIQKEPLGVADALRYAEDFAGGQPVAVILGDNIFEGSLAPFVESFQQQGKGARILLKEVSDAIGFGVAEFDGDRLVRIVEKPMHPKSKYIVTGVYFYDTEVFDIIKGLKPSPRGEFEITDVNNEYIKRGAMEFDFISNWWIDAGTSDSLKKAAHYMRRKVALENCLEDWDFKKIPERC